MAKARLLGMNAAYIPNSKADMRQRKKVYQRGREAAEKAQSAARERRERRERREKE